MTQRGTNSGAGTTYLVVDDHAGFRRALRSHLPGGTLTLVECANGREAIQAFERCHPDWTLMDIEMPELDGFTATREILRRFTDARVIILTQHDTPEFRQEARAAGAFAFVNKDDLSQLGSILDCAASQKRADSQPIKPGIP